MSVGHGNHDMGDLYSPWMGTRELLLRGRNPYGPEVSHEIQMAFYGHVVDQKYGVPGEYVINEQRFAYPVYVVFLLAPTVYADFQKLQMAAVVVLAILTAISMLLWMDVLRWQPPGLMIASIVLFAISSPQIIQGLRLRQLGLAVGFLLALGAWCIARNHLASAGIILALSTIKPQMVVFPLAWFLLWGVSAWSRRWRLLAGFGITFAILVALGELMLPGWPHFFIDGLLAYRKYVGTDSLMCMALGKPVGAVASGIVVVGLLGFVWRYRGTDAASSEFIQALAASFVGASLVLPLAHPFNQVLLLLPAIMVARDWTALPRIGRRAVAAIVAAPWITRFVLLLRHPSVDSPNRLPLLPSAIALLAPFLLAVLLAIRLIKVRELRLRAVDLRPS
jgi:Glycosyltransferase family 87